MRTCWSSWGRGGGWRLEGGRGCVLPEGRPEVGGDRLERARVLGEGGGGGAPFPGRRHVARSDAPASASRSHGAAPPPNRAAPGLAACTPRLFRPHQPPPVLPLHHPPHDPVHRPALLVPADPLRHLVATPPEDDKVRDHVQQTIWLQQCSHIPLQPAPNLPLLPRARVLPLRPVPRRRPRRAVEGLPPRSSPRLPCSGWVCRIKHELIPVGVE